MEFLIVNWRQRYFSFIEGTDSYCRFKEQILFVDWRNRFFSWIEVSDCCCSRLKWHILFVDSSTDSYCRYKGEILSFCRFQGIFFLAPLRNFFFFPFFTPNTSQYWKGNSVLPFAWTSKPSKSCHEPDVKWFWAALYNSDDFRSLQHSKTQGGRQKQ